MGKKGEPRGVDFSQAIFDRICSLIAEGKSLREICAIPGMPARQTFNEWRKRTPELQKQYDLACLDREDVYFEQIIQIADECRVGEKRTTKANGDVETVEIDMVERAKVQIDARKWALKCMNRKKYGDSVTHSGDPDAPVQLVLSGSDIHG